MFEELNGRLTREYESRLTTTSLSTEDIKNRLRKFNRFIEEKEQAYKTALGNPRRGNGVVRSVELQCKISGHEAIIVAPYGTEPYLYNVIAFRNFNNTYTVWLYDATTSAIYGGRFGLSLQAACEAIGLNFGN